MLCLTVFCNFSLKQVISPFLQGLVGSGVFIKTCCTYRLAVDIVGVIVNLFGNIEKFCYFPKQPYLDVYIVTEF
jgi:hypothetical protein